MFTFIAFLLTMLGCINWLMVGLLQYDFIAGLFGFQASIFSRLCYILIGAGALYLLLRIIINKGTFKIFERRKKRQESPNKNSAIPQETLAAANIEAGRENISHYDEAHSNENQDNLFDEHFGQN